MTTTMTRVNVMAMVAAMVMMVCVANVHARDWSVGAAITVPLNMKNIMERGTLTISGEMRSSVVVNNIIDASVTTVNNNTTNVTNKNTNHVHNNNNVRVSGIANRVTVNN